jgi:hypothetical protein
MDDKWTVWGSGAEPLLRDTEGNVRLYVIRAGAQRTDLYIQSPGGAKLAYDFTRGRWTDA